MNLIISHILVWIFMAGLPLISQQVESNGCCSVIFSKANNTASFRHPAAELRISEAKVTGVDSLCLLHLGSDTLICDSAYEIHAGGGYDSYAWYFNGSLLPGTGNTLWATDSGQYICVVTLDSCTATDSIHLTFFTPPDPKFAWSFLGSPGFQYLFQQFTTTPQDTFYWDFGDGTTSMTTNPIHTFPSNGLYQVCLYSTNTCGTERYCQNVQAWVGIDDKWSGPDISIYPNPANEACRLIAQKAFSSPATVKVLNMQGQLMISGEWRSGTSEYVLNTREFPSGNYLIFLQSGTEFTTQKLQVTKR